MKISFLNRLEKRAEDYTEAIIAQLIDTADTSVTPSGSTAAEEVAIGLWGRAFASANVTPSGPIADVLSPNPPKDTDGRREDSGRGWVRELQGRWPGVLG